jgi:hypothetical protein
VPATTLPCGRLSRPAPSSERRPAAASCGGGHRCRGARPKSIVGHEVDDIRDALCHAAYARSPIRPQAIEHAADEVRHLAVAYLGRGYELPATAALRYAARRDRRAGATASR